MILATVDGLSLWEMDLAAIAKNNRIAIAAERLSFVAITLPCIPLM
jgi:hypothetical protein